MLYGCLSTRRANIVLDNARFTHRVFGGFINGKLLDSLIIGILCFVGMTALRMPYAMLISVVVGVTNIIPFFGPFIGAIPSGLLILLIDPLKALYFVLFILALQQFDGNILGPKILGDSTGLSSFWVMFAILLAGGLFGFVGMVVGVPLFAVLYSILSGLVCHSLRRRGMRRKHRPIMNWTMWMSAHTTSYTMRLRPTGPRDLRTGLNDRLSALNWKIGMYDTSPILFFHFPAVRSVFYTRQPSPALQHPFHHHSRIASVVHFLACAHKTILGPECLALAVSFGKAQPGTPQTLPFQKAEALFDDRRSRPFPGWRNPP